MHPGLIVWLEQLFHDLRFGLRMLRRSPGFSILATTTGLSRSPA